MKKLLSIFLLALSCCAMADWVEYSQAPNGDVFFYDDARVLQHESEFIVWTRVRYRRSIMGASSYESLLRLNCADNSLTVVQSTFFSDDDWKKPAMATDTTVKPKKQIDKASETTILAQILCHN